MWVQVQQRVRRHDLRVEADTVEMQRTKRRSIGLDAAFVDLTKAFDTISLSGLWKILPRVGCPPNFSPSSDSSMKIIKVR